MTKYRITFMYGTYHLWVDIETNRYAVDNRRGFADLAQSAVHLALESMPTIERKNIAHDYAIFELTKLSSGDMNATLVYEFDTLINE